MKRSLVQLTLVLALAMTALVGCTAREALIGVGAGALGAAAGAYAGDKYDIVDDDDHDHDHDHDHKHRRHRD